MTTRGSTVARVLVAAVVVLTGVVATAPASTATASGSSGSSDWTAISAGTDHTCGIRAGGHLYCWGSNDNGQLGDGTTDNRASPVEVVGARDDWTSVSAGSQYTCGRRASGRLFCWGANIYGQLGDGTSTDRSTPSQVSGRRTDWTIVVAHGDHACALRKTKRLYCWGSNDAGQLGDGTTTSRSTPTPVFGRATWTAVDLGFRYTCGLRTDRTLACWGDNGAGQLGDGTTAGRTVPTRVASSVTDWTTITAASYHTCARRSSGRLFCWGYNAFGQLGDGSFDDQVTPVQVTDATSSFATVVAGGFHTCARQTSGRMSCWGYNSNGQLGDATTTDRRVPTAVAGGADDWRRLDLGVDRTCALTRTGRAYCWGADNRSTPTEVVVP